MSRPWTASIVWLAFPCLLEAAALKPARVEQFFISPDQPAVLRWQVESGALGDAVPYTVRDYAGKATGSGRAVRSGGNTLEATLRLPQGLYEIEIPAGKERFGILSLPAWQGQPEAFFAIDGALSWLVRDDAVREGLVKAAHRMGISMIRERLRWGAVSAAAGQWRWDADQRYDTLRQTCLKHRVEVLEMAHDGPPWLGQVGVYPQDLVGAARSWGEIAKRWRPTWGALEVWNEPDIHFGGNLPADQYVPLVKAIAYGLADARVDVPLVGGVMAHANRDFLDTAARNRLLESIDAFSFHNYGPAMRMESAIAEYRAWLDNTALGTWPLWITECGRPWQTGPERPPVDQDAASALDITAKGIEARACGIARYFPFVYPDYVEGKYNFGMVDKRATPLRSIAAYAQAIRALAGRAYLGDLGHGDPGLARARVFGDDRQTVAVLYTGKVEPAAKVRLGLAVLRVEGIDGRSLAPAPDGSLPVPDGLAYAWLERDRLGERLLTNTSARKLLRASRTEPTKPRRPGPLVLRYQYDAKLLRPTSEGYHFRASQAGKTPLVVRAFNLSEIPVQAALRLACDPPALSVGDGAAQSIRVPARSSADVRWEIGLSDAFERQDRVRVEVLLGPTASKSSRELSVVFFGEPTLIGMLGRSAHWVRLPIQDRARWTPSAPPRAEMSMESTPEASWLLKVKFAEGDRWVYPQFKLPQQTVLQAKGGLVIRARCPGSADVRVLLLEGDADVVYTSPKPLFTADGQWHVRTVRFRDFVLSPFNAPDPNGRLDLDRVRRISVGLSSQSAQNTLEVSDVCVVDER